MPKVTAALESSPPFAVPPLSLATTVTVALPNAFAAGAYVSVPPELTAGCVEKRPELVLETANVTFWLASLAGPGEIAVAHPTD